MLASRADSFLSGTIEVFQQPDEPPTCGSHGPRCLSSCVVLCCEVTSRKQQEDGRARKKSMLWIGDSGLNYLASL